MVEWTMGFLMTSKTAFRNQIVT